MIIPDYSAQPLHFFASEADAVDWTVSLFDKFGFWTEREKRLQSGLRCDLYVRMQEGEIEFPMEIKKELTAAKHFRKASAQAADYANELKLPAFIGPVVYKRETHIYPRGLNESERKIEHLEQLLRLAQRRRTHDYLLFTMQQNVGFVETDEDMSWISIRQEPDLKFIYDTRSNRNQYRPQFWGWRENRGSNFTFTGLSLVGDPR